MSRPALLISGTHSGCGKTTVTLGVMAALARRGLAVQPFKCGPDFIDPSLHHMVTGKVSRNLDVRMCGEAWVRATFARHAPASGAAGIAVVEGVMGLFDGGQGSAATLAKTLDLPVLLVVDVRSTAESVAAVVHGFAGLDPSLRLAGVVLNRVGSARHQQLVTEAIGQHCAVPVLGCLPRAEAISMPSRHLGLHMGDEQPLDGQGLARLIDLIETHVDLERLVALAGQRRTAPLEAPPLPGAAGPPVRLGVARDAAFCFYYQDNLDLLSAAGAELVPFSPLEEEQLPPDLAGLYLGGGYPELHAGRLGENQAMLASIRALAEAGRPVYAECGGFMTLCRAIVDGQGQATPMAGLYPFTARMQNQLRSLGYRRPQVVRDCLLAPAGSVLHGHEFHYSTIDAADTVQVDTAFRLDDGRAEGFLARANTLAGYIHLHWGRTPEVASRLVAACRQAAGINVPQSFNLGFPAP